LEQNQTRRTSILGGFVMAEIDVEFTRQIF
jgi:hypothetical protein